MHLKNLSSFEFIYFLMIINELLLDFLKVNFCPIRHQKIFSEIYIKQMIFVSCHNIFDFFVEDDK